MQRFTRRLRAFADLNLSVVDVRQHLAEVARVELGGVRFAVVVVDRGATGDVFRIDWGGGTSRGGTVVRGGVTVR